jgi:glycosyltransferase involved in cell wall biosynthesis
MDPLHICYVEPGYPHPHGGGGAGTYVRLVGRELALRGHRASVVADWCPHCPAFSWDSGIAVHRPRLAGTLHWYVSKIPGLRVAALSVQHLIDGGYRLFRFIEGLHRKEPLSVVEFSEGGDFWHAFYSSFPILAHLHGSRYTFLRQSGRATGRADWYQRRLELALIRRAWRVISPSENMVQLVRQELGSPLPAEVVLPYPLDPALVRSGDDPAPLPGAVKTVVMAARNDPVKGANILAQAVPLVRAHFPAAEFDFIGCERSVRTAPSDGMRFHPFMAKEKLVEFYRRADVCVVPSLWDNSPNTVYEAMALGKAVVASRVGGIPELIDDGETGRLVAPGNPAELAKTITRLLVHDQERITMGRKARQRIKHLANLDKNVSLRLAVYEQVAWEFASSHRRSRSSSRRMACDGGAV